MSVDTGGAELTFSTRLHAPAWTLKKQKNECIANKISEFLKFSNLKNLDFFGKHVVGEH